ncbi:hypothetical protein ACLFMI_20935 [Pseudonocardia nantongensis]|uniref:hypothetical protein n=1 Tax=Pseudonocardia nantongensis TaxID=1181885 RepID=UPI00397CA2E6
MRTDRRAVPPRIVEDGRIDDWFRLVDVQAGMVHVNQLAEFGVTWAATLAQVEGNRWNGFVRSVYATFTGPLPRESTISGALLYGGPAAILSHRTAAEEWGLVPAEPGGPVHVTVPYTSSATSQHGLVVVHRSRAHRHIVVATVPPRTSSADTAIDLAVEEDDAVAARLVLFRLLTDSRLRLADVERRLVERPPRRYRRALLGAIALVRDGVHSALEELYLTSVEEAHGLPAGERQVPFSVDGQTLWEDVTYDRAGLPLTVRLDGRTHLRSNVAFRDRRRDNAAELAGRARLTFGWRDLSADPCAAAEDVARVMRRLGWYGPPAACAACGPP